MQPSVAPALDPDVVNLAKALRQVESSNDPTAVGKSGEYGSYQYTPAKWAKDSAAAGVNVSLQDATPEQQNEVAYKSLAAMKASGMNIGEIASEWNSGNKDAYLDPSFKGTNSHGASYDVPAYAKSVADAYHKFKDGGQVLGDSTQGAGIQPPVNPDGSADQSKGDMLAPPVLPPSVATGDLADTKENTPVANPFADASPGQNIAKGNLGANVDRSKGAIKGVLSSIRNASGVDTSPVVKGQLAAAPAFAKDVEAEKGILIPNNAAQRMGATDSEIGASILPGEEGAEAASTGIKGAASKIKDVVSPVSKFVEKHKFKSAVAGFLAAHLLKNTKVGNAIENATGIKELLDLL